VADGDGTQNGDGEYRTFQGAGFGTLMVRLASGPKETPAVASNRAYLRGSLPAVYQEGDFGMRFIGALETLLDPIVAVLDALPAHFSAGHAPRDVLDLLSAWLGIDLDESQTPAQRREMVRHAAELGRRQGTRAGIELALSGSRSRSCRSASRTSAG
jgi:phage tail-like protein